MKRQVALGAFLMVVLLLLSSCAAKAMKRDEDSEGARRDWSRKDAPKVIESKVIDRFECEFVLDSQTVEGDNYLIFEMAREKEAASCRMQAYGGWSAPLDLVFDAPLSTLDDLQGLAEEHQLATYNGIDRQVDGLPEHQGSQLWVIYASGERIYAADNSSTFLDYRAENAIQDFFQDLARSRGVLE